ncbi:hypothetical protein GUITHDRAFT_62151, partial [Guillardia theta CCMP2712]
LGSGGFGLVFRAVYHEKDVAVKEPHNLAEFHNDSDKKKMFIREVNHLYRLKHKNVVDFIGAVAEDETGEPCYLILTELLPHKLEEYILTPAGRQPRVREKLVLDMAQGLAYLHDSKIIHRDIKPQNIMVNSQGTAKLIDFGLSKQEEKSKSTSASRSCAGTKNWMAPEVNAGEASSFASDVYSLGLVAFFVVTGEVP